MGELSQRQIQTLTSMTAILNAGIEATSGSKWPMKPYQTKIILLTDRC